MFGAIGVASDDRKTVRIWAVLSWTTSSWTSRTLDMVSGNVRHWIMWSLPKKGTVREFWVGFRGASKEGYPLIVIYDVVREQEGTNRVQNTCLGEHLRCRPGCTA